MPVGLEITIDDTRVLDILTRIQARFGNLKPAMGMIGETVQASIQRNFEVGGRPQKWDDLSDLTKERRAAKKKWPGQILVVSGVMKMITYQAKKDSVVLSAGSEYAATHHFGAKKGQFGIVVQNVKEHFRTLKSGTKQKVAAHQRKAQQPWGDIPAREFMLVQPEDWDEIKLELMDYLFS